MTHTTPNHRPQPAAATGPSVRSLLLSMGDTTWRMFVPTAILVGASLTFARQPSLRLTLLIAAPVLGLAISILLIKRQLRSAS